VGKILALLKAEGIPINRLTFLRLEKEGLFISKRSVGKWRMYTPEEAEIIVKLIKENYGIEERRPIN